MAPIPLSDSIYTLLPSFVTELTRVLDWLMACTRAAPGSQPATPAARPVDFTLSSAALGKTHSAAIPEASIVTQFAPYRNSLW
jgi:hypothetical protein